MVNISYNINKMDNPFPPSLTKHTKKRQSYMTLKIQGLAWYRHQQVAWLNRLIGS
jgi:hypothetical protein